MKQKYIIGISIFVILLIAGALFAWEKKAQEPAPIHPAPVTPIPPTVTPPTPITPTSPKTPYQKPAGWKTYKINDVTIKYPKNLVYRAVEGTTDFIAEGKNNIVISISSFTPAQSPLDEWFTLAMKQAGRQIVHKENMKVGNTEYGVFYKEKFNNGSEGVGYIFNHSNSTYTFENYNAEDSKLFFDILSTIKFSK